jgi:hypothetical protein
MIYIIHYEYAKTKILFISLNQSEIVFSKIMVFFIHYFETFLELIHRETLPIINHIYLLNIKSYSQLIYKENQV